MTDQDKTILIVDDDKLLQRSLKALFERHGYAVVLADDGNVGLQQLAERRIDVVMLDILMPEKEGLETLIEIKRRHPKLPVVVASGAATRGKIDFFAVAKKFGANAVLKKPTPPQEMLRVIDAQAGRAA